MRLLLISGLLCLPALIMLFSGWPHSARPRMEDVNVTAEMATVTPPSVITISLPPRQPQTEPPQTDLAWDDSFAAAAMPPEPTPPSPKRVLHARAPVPRQSTSVVVAQAAFQEQADTPWARMVHWLTRHEAPKVWAPGGGEGAG